jgi:uncharacterized protein YbjT (DUF2867 family)
LLESGFQVRVLVRDPAKVRGRRWLNEVEVFEGDVLKPETLDTAFSGASAAYYLIHSMSTEGDFKRMDREAAANVAAAAERNGLRQIIYLGGLGRRDINQSAHLSSRHEVGDLLRAGGTPVTELRAAVVVGSGSLSFEMIHHLVNRLPAMICPRWVYTRTQPIAIRDVLTYLVQSLNRSQTYGLIIDIGGPDILTYRDMMLGVADILGLRRYLVPVPVLTPRLSSYWVNLVTPIRAALAKALIDSLRSETVCENDLARQHYDIEPLPFRRAAELALERAQVHGVETTWTDATTVAPQPIDPSHLRVDRRETDVAVPAKTVFDVISSIGGDNGWFYADWLWRLRGFLDQQFGGVGLRRGRRHPTEISLGEALDFWRVQEYVPLRKLVLRAEMRVWGQAWLGFEVEPVSDNSCRLIQTARYYPRGVTGLLYWYLVYPLHALVFRGLIKSIASRAIRKSDSVTA